MVESVNTEDFVKRPVAVRTSVNNLQFDHLSKNKSYQSSANAMKVQNTSHHQSVSDRIDQFFAEVSSQVCCKMCS